MNVLLIMVDQHARDFVGCYSGGVDTPNIDSLAEKGTLFSHAYCCSPVCAPTRASFAAGRYAHELGVWDNTTSYDGNPPGWFQYLQTNGVRVTTIGRLDFEPGVNLGVEDMRIPGMHGSPDTTELFRDKPIVQRRAEYYTYYDIEPRKSGLGLLEADSEPTEKYLTSETVNWLKNKRPTDRPWMLHVGYSTPHPKWQPEKSLFDKYLTKAPDLPAKYLQGFDELSPADQRCATYSCGYTEPDTEKIKYFHAAYLAVVEEFDHEIGKILTALREEGIFEDTMIIYVSDHGESARAHGNLGKRSMYEESIGIPLIITGPGIPRGKIEKLPVGQLDIFPTIADVLDISQPGDFRGRSLVPLMKGETEGFDDAPVFIECHAGKSINAAFAIRIGKWKFVENLYEAPALYDLENDPDEMYDLVKHEQDNEQTRRQIEKMRTALHEICDPEKVDAEAKKAQQHRRTELMEAGELEEPTFQRGYQRRTDKLVPWEWEVFEKLYHG
jgi:choline-sulfatase